MLCKVIGSSCFVQCLQKTSNTVAESPRYETASYNTFVSSLFRLTYTAFVPVCHLYLVFFSMSSLPSWRIDTHICTCCLNGGSTNWLSGTNALTLMSKAE